MDAREIAEVLRLHGKWRMGDGVRANLRGADLSEACLSEADLSGADLSGAYLREAYLSGADLGGADLRGANLRGAYLCEAYLSGADLSGAYLRGADLSGADLSGADLRGANLREACLSEAYLGGANLSGADLREAYLREACLSEADLSGANLPIRPPVVEQLDARILAAIDGPGAAGFLRMDTWHTCETTHCLAGWAIHLAGADGYALEIQIGANAAGALIYHASTGRIPNFFASNDDAIADLRARCRAADK